MTLGPLGYGRYNDDPNWIGCPRARTSETPCCARDGHLAMADPIPETHPNGCCVGCGADPADLLTELVREVTTPNEVTALADDLADVLSRMVVGWQPLIGDDLAKHPDVVRVMARYRAVKDHYPAKGTG